MQNYRRATTPGATYCFTVNTYARRKLLTQPYIYSALKQAFRSTRSAYPFDIEAIVLLPDHLHCIWKLPEGDSDFSKRWSMIKRKTSQCINDPQETRVSPSRAKRRERHFWQRRFWEHQVRDDRDFELHASYIHWNPVKHGYVNRVNAWPYSSFHKYVRNGIYPLDWGGVTAPEGMDFGEV